MNVVQMWLAGLISLSALYLVVANPQGVASGVQAATQFVTQTDKTAIGRA